MTTLAIVGAGRGLGAAVARRFAREGFAVALISRNREHVDALASDLAAEGISAAGFVANVREPASIAAALEAATEKLGPIEVLQYSPLPQKDFMRPVLATTPADLVGPVEFSIFGPVAAVHQVVPGMRFLGGGSILFVNGGTAVKPVGRLAGTSIAFAGQSAFATMLHDELAGDDIHVAQLIIPGSIDENHPQKNPAALADLLWNMHKERGEFRTYATELDAD